MKTQNDKVFGNYYQSNVRDSTRAVGLYLVTPQHVVSTNNLVYWVDALEQSVNTPNFHKLKRYQRPENYYYRHLNLQNYPRLDWTSHIVYTNGRHDVAFDSAPISAFGAVTDTTDNPTKWPGVDPTNLAINRLQSSVNQTSGNIMVTMAEADKTAKHLFHTATRLVSAYRNLKKGRLGDFARDLGMTTRVSEVRAYRNRWRRKSAQGSDLKQFAANSWLEYSYGWKPLLQDFHAQAENFARVMTDYGYVVREAKASAKSGTVVYTEENLATMPTYGASRRVQVDDRVAFTVRYRIRNGSQQVANNFGLLNPLEVAWEVIPFSFVADWFLPIGDFIQNLTAYNGLEFAGGTKSRIRKSEIKCRLFSGPGGGVNPRSWIEPFSVESTGYHRFKERQILQTFPSQSFPTFKDPRSFAHAASAISLLQSVFLGSRSGAMMFR